MMKGIGGFTKEIKISPEEAEKLKSDLLEIDGEFYPKSVFEWKNVEDLYKLSINQQIEINKLNNIINKAIDFLKENACIDEDVEYFCNDLRYDECKKLLDILKGGDKE